MLIYLIRNTVNGKGYVGQTIQTIEERWYQHQREAFAKGLKYALYNAIRKYGADAFEIAALDHAENISELNRLEKYHIQLQGTLFPHGYNIAIGGKDWALGRKHSPETIAKMSTAQKGHTVSPEAREKLSAIKKGKPLHSQETRARIGAAAKGNTYAKWHAPLNKGKKMSEEQRQKLRDAWVRRKAKREEIHAVA